MSEPSAAPGKTAPTCYRHPDRETYVRCTRCDRPICPDCMVSASVGFQCPECVAEGNATVRQATTQFGGALTEHPGLITRILIGINVAAFLIQLLVGLDQVRADFGMWPLGVTDGEYYRLVTAGFLHGSFFHIALNMAALYFLGIPLETLVGRLRFVLIYAMALIGGSVASFCFSPLNTLSVGASGAVFGLMGAFVVVAWKQKLDLRPFLVIIGINLVFGFLPGTSIDWRAHLGGLVTGAIVAAAIVLAPRTRRIPVLVATTVLLLVVFALATAWRVNDLHDMFVDMFTNQLGR